MGDELEVGPLMASRVPNADPVPYRPWRPEAALKTSELGTDAPAFVPSVRSTVRWLSGSRCDAAAFTLAGRTGTPTPMFPDSDSDYLNLNSQPQ